MQNFCHCQQHNLKLACCLLRLRLHRRLCQMQPQQICGCTLQYSQSISRTRQTATSCIFILEFGSWLKSQSAMQPARYHKTENDCCQLCKVGVSFRHYHLCNIGFWFPFPARKCSKSIQNVPVLVSYVKLCLLKIMYVVK